MRMNVSPRDTSLVNSSWRTALSYKTNPSPLSVKLFNYIRKLGIEEIATIFFWGCGRGRNMVAAPDFSRITGYDINLDLLQEHIPNELEEAEIIGRDQLDTIEERHYDFALCVMVLNTIPYQPQRDMLAEMREFLNADTLLFEVRKEVTFANEAEKEPYQEGWISRTFANGDETYQQNFSMKELKKLVRKEFGYDDYPYQTTFTSSSSIGLIISREEIHI